VNHAFLIIADDLSGAADCAVGFVAAGFDSVVLLDVGGPDAAPSVEVVAVDTDSRRDAAPVAAGKARAALAVHGAQRRVVKKIDSTLRGGWAAEVAAMQPALGLALVAPAFPDLGRTVRDGTVLVHGTPLARTATWRLEHADHESRPAPMLEAAGLRCETVPADLLDGPPDALLHTISQARERGCQALVFDTERAAQLGALAEATRDLPDVFWVASAGLAREVARCARPGAATATVQNTSTAGCGVLTVVGSLSPIAERQIACLAERPGSPVHTIAPRLLREPPASGAAAPSWARAIDADLARGLDPVACIGTDADLDPSEGPVLARHLARHLAPAMREAAGLVLTGGETARAMLTQLGIARLRMLGETEPGVALSCSMAPHAQYIVTKAGAFGDAGSLDRARRAIQSRMSAAGALNPTPSVRKTPMTAYVPAIGITMGDAAGIGPEIIAKSFANHDLSTLARAVVIGDAGRLRKVADLLGLDVRVRPIASMDEARFERGVIDCFDLHLIPEDLPFGKLSAVAGDAAFRFIERAVELAKEGRIDAICTAPLNKEALHAGGHKFPGHTEMLAHLTGVEEVSMMLVAPNLRVIHVTTHIGIIDAIRKIEPGLVERTIQRGYDTLRKAKIENPRIAVCGINPHAGENGLFGYGEEEEKILPAIEVLRARGLNIEGPLPADTLFFRAGRGDFDLVVAMYHDQGHGPVKVMGLEAGVNITVGLDVIRTSVDHGTAFDIAGKGIADERSLLEALRQGAELATRR
jgi:4-hydroxythreonine-4-phosphate dehydrogenase